LYELVIDWRLLKTTYAHRFYVFRWGNDDWYKCNVPYEWVAAGKLHVWDVLMMSDGMYVTIDSIEHYPYHGQLYNIWVENVHNYYVDKWYLVHNAKADRDDEVDWGKPLNPFEDATEIEVERH
jgi:hypothetical protein